MSRARNPRVEIREGKAYLDDRCIPLPDSLVLQRELTPRGANGYVFVAEDRVLKRSVAVKLWLPQLHDSRDKMAQGIAEARKIANVRHPNIVEIFFAGQTADDVFFVTMEYLRGPTLRQWLDADSPEFDQRYNVWRGIVDALECAHRKGVYHGDLHPGNVIVCGNDPKVIDFGTSVFARTAADSHKREARLIVELVQMMFPERRLSDMANGTWQKLRPEAALAGSSAWVKIIKLENGLMRRKPHWDDEDDLDISEAVFHLAIIVRYAPIFNVRALAKWFRSIVEKERYVLHFLDALRAQFLNVLNPSNRYEIRFDVTQSADEKLAVLEPLTQLLQCRFHESATWG